MYLHEFERGNERKTEQYYCLACSSGSFRLPSSEKQKTGLM